MIAVGSGRPVEDSDGWTIRTRDRGLAAHYEDTVVITRGRPEPAFFMLYAYSKADQGDLTPAQTKALSRVAREELS